MWLPRWFSQRSLSCFFSWLWLDRADRQPLGLGGLPLGQARSGLLQQGIGTVHDWPRLSSPGHAPRTALFLAPRRKRRRPSRSLEIVARSAGLHKSKLVDNEGKKGEAPASGRLPLRVAALTRSSRRWRTGTVIPLHTTRWQRRCGGPSAAAIRDSLSFSGLCHSGLALANTPGSTAEQP